MEIRIKIMRLDYVGGERERNSAQLAWAMYHAELTAKSGNSRKKDN